MRVPLRLRYHNSGGGSPVAPVPCPVPTATAIVAPFSISNRETHETNVEFTRDLVVQLVENLPTKSVRVEPPVVQIIGPHSKGSHSPCKTSAISENSFTSVTSDAPEPDHLQSDDANKKQIDTDTDTTEYESAGDSTVPPSPLGSLAGDYSAQDRNGSSAEYSPVGDNSSPSAQLEQAEKVNSSLNSTVVSSQVNDLNITGLCSAFEGVNLNTSQCNVPISPVVQDVKQSSDISGLCLAFEGVHLQTPSRVSNDCYSDSICDSAQTSIEFQSTPLSKEKLWNTPNFAQYSNAVLNTEQPVPSLPISDEPAENVCSFESSFSERQTSPQDSTTVNVGRCDTEAQLALDETEFLTEAPNKTSTPTDENISKTDEANSVKELVGSSSEYISILSEGKPCTKLDETFEDSSRAKSATSELEHPNNETLVHLSVNSASHQTVSKSLNDTFELLPEVSSSDKTEAATELLNQTFEVLPEVNQDVPSKVTQSLNETFDFLLPQLCENVTEVAEEPLNTTFEILPCVPLDSKSQEVSQLNKTFEQLPEDKIEIVTELLNKTFELLPDVQSHNLQGISQQLNKTFEQLAEDCADKTEVQEHLLNKTFAFEDKESAGKSLFTCPEKEDSVGAVGSFEEKALVNGIDVNGNAQLQTVQHVKNEKFDGKLVSSPIQKFVNLSSDRDSKHKKKNVHSSEYTDHILQQVPECERENADIADHNCLSSSVTRCDEQYLPVQCETRDTYKLHELYKICDEQQKALEQDDEEFVNAETFFANEQEVLKSSEASLCSSVSEADLPKVKSNSADSGQEVTFEQISVEAKRLSQQFARSASELLASACTGDSVNIPGFNEMENSNRVEGVNMSALGSSPASNRHSPRSIQGSRGSSPAKRPVGGDGTPKIKQKTLSNTPKELDYTDVEDPFKPRSRIQNSPPRNQSMGEAPVPCQKDSVESSLQSVLSNCHNHSEAGPEIAEVPGSEVFKDPSAFEFLSSFGSQQHSERNARLESLYVKFDPLVGTGASTNSNIVLPPGVINGSHIEEAYSCKLEDSCKSLEADNTSASRQVESPQGRLAAGDAGLNCLQVTPSPASLFIDKLISLSPSPNKTSPVPSPPRQQVPSPRKAVNATPIQQTPVLRKAHPSPAPAAPVKSGLSEMEETAMLEELLRLKELLSEQDKAHALEAAEKNEEMTNLQSRLVEAEDRLAKANKQVADKVKTAKDMSVILDEYEKTISRLIADKEQEQRAHELQVNAIAKERDVHKGHLDTIEIAFSDLHKKYERSKEIIEGLRKNEEVLRSSLAEYESSIRSKVQQYEALKKHAVGQLEDANQELDSVRRSHAGETAKLQAMLKKAELKVSSLEEMLEQKIKENQELTHICDELINKVGAGN